jgi:hypothetical protein
MPKITALLHTHNDALRLGRALDSLRPCDEVLVIACYAVPIREQNHAGWQRCPPEVRLVNRKVVNWLGEMPPEEKCDATLNGDLLCFHQP